MLRGSSSSRKNHQMSSETSSTTTPKVHIFTRKASSQSIISLENIFTSRSVPYNVYQDFLLLPGLTRRLTGKNMIIVDSNRDGLIGWSPEMIDSNDKIQKYCYPNSLGNGGLKWIKTPDQAYEEYTRMVQLEPSQGASERFRIKSIHSLSKDKSFNVTGMGASRIKYSKIFYQTDVSLSHWPFLANEPYNNLLESLKNTPRAIPFSTVFDFTRPCSQLNNQEKHIVLTSTNTLGCSTLRSLNSKRKYIDFILVGDLTSRDQYMANNVILATQDYQQVIQFLRSQAKFDVPPLKQKQSLHEAKNYIQESKTNSYPIKQSQTSRKSNSPETDSNIVATAQFLTYDVPSEEQTNQNSKQINRQSLQNQIMRQSSQQKCRQSGKNGQQSLPQPYIRQSGNQEIKQSARESAKQNIQQSLKQQNTRQTFQKSNGEQNIRESSKQQSNRVSSPEVVQGQSQQFSGRQQYLGYKQTDSGMLPISELSEEYRCSRIENPKILGVISNMGFNFPKQRQSTFSVTKEIVPARLNSISRESSQREKMDENYRRSNNGPNRSNQNSQCRRLPQFQNQNSSEKDSIRQSLNNSLNKSQDKRAQSRQGLSDYIMSPVNVNQLRRSQDSAEGRQLSNSSNGFGRSEKRGIAVISNNQRSPSNHALAKSQGESWYTREQPVRNNQASLESSVVNTSSNMMSSRGSGKAGQNRLIPSTDYGLVEQGKSVQRKKSGHPIVLRKEPSAVHSICSVTSAVADQERLLVGNDKIRGEYERLNYLNADTSSFHFILTDGLYYIFEYLRDNILSSIDRIEQCPDLLKIPQKTRSGPSACNFGIIFIRDSFKGRIDASSLPANYFVLAVGPSPRNTVEVNHFIRRGHIDSLRHIGLIQKLLIDAQLQKYVVYVPGKQEVDCLADQFASSDYSVVEHEQILDNTVLQYCWKQKKSLTRLWILCGANQLGKIEKVIEQFQLDDCSFRKKWCQVLCVSNEQNAHRQSRSGLTVSFIPAEKRYSNYLGIINQGSVVQVNNYEPGEYIFYSRRLLKTRLYDLLGDQFPSRFERISFDTPAELNTEIKRLNANIPRGDPKKRVFVVAHETDSLEALSAKLVEEVIYVGRRGEQKGTRVDRVEEVVEMLRR